MGIPLIVGVTGHRNIRSEDTHALKESVRSVLNDLIYKHPHSKIMMLNSLAEGADQLCAEVALELKIPFTAVLPMPVPEYEEDFQGDVLQSFRSLLDHASEILIAKEIEPKMNESRDYDYRQAGIYLASHSHVLLACWDGKTASPGGCGTAEIVDFMLNRSYTASCSLFRGMGDGAVIQIFTPREGEPTSEQAGSTHTIENAPGVMTESMRVTDKFNHDAQKSKTSLPEGILNSDEISHLDDRLSRILEVFCVADSLSVRFRDRYLKTILWLSILGVTLVVSFLMYDEMESDLFLIFYAGALLMAVLCYSKAHKSQYHRKYLEYRVLAEVLRNQFYLSASGIPDSVCDYIAWPHESANAWIRQAVSAIMTGPESTVLIDHQQVREYWIDGQAGYHRKALDQERKKNEWNQCMTRFFVGLSLLIFILIVVLESGFKQIAQKVILDSSMLQSILMMHSDQDVTLRGGIKIILGLISSATLFLSNYYGKLSLSRKITNHEKMVARLLRAQVLLDTQGISWESVYRELARESIIENGEWLTYSRDQPPTINI